MVVIYGSGEREEEVAENPCLKNFGAACKLGDCRWDKCNPSFRQVGQQLFFSRFHPDSGADNTAARKVLILVIKGVTVPYDMWGLFQKIISEKR